MKFFDTNSRLHSALIGVLQEAKDAHSAKQDKVAASHFDRAAEILLQLAEAQPTRELELKMKKAAIKYREFSKRLRSGSVPSSKRVWGPGLAALESANAETCVFEEVRIKDVRQALGVIRAARCAYEDSQEGESAGLLERAERLILQLIHNDSPSEEISPNQDDSQGEPDGQKP